jgi:hypothetical protein
MHEAIEQVTEPSNLFPKRQDTIEGVPSRVWVLCTCAAQGRPELYCEAGYELSLDMEGVLRDAAASGQFAAEVEALVAEGGTEADWRRRRGWHADNDEERLRGTEYPRTTELGGQLIADAPQRLPPDWLRLSIVSSRTVRTAAGAE